MLRGETLINLRGLTARIKLLQSPGRDMSGILKAAVDNKKRNAK
jgi:hypothetical protein